MMDRPILFCAPMVHAILDELKTQTWQALATQRLEVVPMKAEIGKQWVKLNGTGSVQGNGLSLHK
jgi:hypothetical protein